MLKLARGRDAADGSRADLAYGAIRAAITGGKYPPGSRMREAEIAGSLGISRTPVRDALGRLESEGLLVAAPRRGLIVADLDPERVAEIYAVRQVLSGLAARLAAQHASDAAIRTMRDILDREARVDRDDVSQLVQLNSLFHRVVSTAARNRYLGEMLGAVETSLALLPRSTYLLPRQANAALKQHRTIVDAIARRQPDVAERTSSDHVRSAEQVRQFMLATESADLASGLSKNGSKRPRRSAARGRSRARGPLRPPRRR